MRKLVTAARTFLLSASTVLAATAIDLAALTAPFAISVSLHNQVSLAMFREKRLRAHANVIAFEIAVVATLTAALTTVATLVVTASTAAETAWMRLACRQSNGRHETRDDAPGLPQSRQ